MCLLANYLRNLRNQLGVQQRPWVALPRIVRHRHFGQQHRKLLRSDHTGAIDVGFLLPCKLVVLASALRAKTATAASLVHFAARWQQPRKTLQHKPATHSTAAAAAAATPQAASRTAERAIDPGANDLTPAFPALTPRLETRVELLRFQYCLRWGP